MSSAPDPPAPVDPYAAASAQSSANAQTAIAQTLLNNPQQVTPWGTTTNTQTGSYTETNPDGSTTEIPTYTTTQSLSPDQQRLLQQNENLGIYGNQIAGVALGNAQNSLEHPLTSKSFAPIQTSAGATPTLQNGYASGPAVQTSYSSGGPITNTYDLGGNIQKSVDLASAPTTFAQTANQVQGSLGNTDYTAAVNQATNAALARLQPNVDQQTGNLQAQLANQGLVQGSAACNAGMLQNNQSINDLRLGAVATGDAEQQALFGETLNAGQFANSAQQQEYDQALGRGQFAQAGVGQNNASTLAAGQFANAAQGQQNSENAALAGFQNTAQQQGYNQNALLAAFGNNAAGQINSQNAAQAAFGNNTALAQYQAALQDAQFGNEAEQQQYTQKLGLNNQSINQVDALRSGGQMTTPQFQGYSAGTVDQTPISADIYSSADLAQKAYQTQATMAGQTNAGLYGIGGNLASAFILSDRRAKTDIKKVGTWTNGLPIYRYRYLGSAEPDIGFMADEVERLRPDAVAHDDFGFASVDYEKAMA